MLARLRPPTQCDSILYFLMFDFSLLPKKFRWKRNKKIYNRCSPAVILESLMFFCVPIINVNRLIIVKTPRDVLQLFSFRWIMTCYSLWTHFSVLHTIFCTSCLQRTDYRKVKTEPLVSSFSCLSDPLYGVLWRLKTYWTCGQSMLSGMNKQPIDLLSSWKPNGQSGTKKAATAAIHE